MADVVGYLIGGCMYSAREGELLFPGDIRAKAAIRQMEQNGPPVQVLDFKAEAFWKGEKVKWSFSMTRDQFNNLEENLPKFLPAGMEVNYDDGMLADAIAAFSELPQHFPTKDCNEWADDNGLYYLGRRVSNFHCEIVDERIGPLNETLFKIRSKKTNGTYKYVDNITFDQMLQGGWENRVVSMPSTHGILIGMTLREIWTKTTPTQRKAFAVEELRQERRQIDDRIGQLEGR